jgi:DHA2 family multidrug resistance protein
VTGPGRTLLLDPSQPGYTPPPRGSREHRLLNIGFFAMVIGMFMAILDIQIVASSIAQIQAGVSASADEIKWIQSAYLVAEVIGIPLSGLLNRAFGMRRLFVGSALGFVAASVLCALAWDLNSLIVFRCIQGFVGAAMIPTTMAAAFSLFGSERSMLQQVAIGMVATLAPSIGPTLGGWITEHLGWHWLFLVNVIPGLVACYFVWRYIPRAPLNIMIIRRFDVIGFAAMALFLGSFELLFDDGPAAGWFQDGHIVQLAVICTAAGALFFWRSLTHREPVVNLAVFRDRNFATGALVVAVVGFGLFGSVFVTPLFLAQVRGFSALQIGQIMSIAGVFMFLGGPISGALIRRYDPRIVLVTGLALCGIGLYLNQFLTAESGFAELFWPQALRGAGLIMSMVPCNFLALGTLSPQQLPNATGLFTVCRNLGGAVGLSVIGTMQLHFFNLHRQELSAGMDPARPEVQTFIAQAEARLALTGAADPHGQALMQLAQRVQLEASVMTFNNMFFAMAASFAVMVLLTPLMKRPAAKTAGPAH